MSSPSPGERVGVRLEAVNFPKVPKVPEVPEVQNVEKVPEVEEVSSPFSLGEESGMGFKINSKHSNVMLG